MPKFQYTARDGNGKKIQNSRDAASEAELYQLLKQEGLFLMSSREIVTVNRTRRIKSKELGEFCRELGTLQKAGVSLVRALGIISEEENLKKAHRAVYAELQRLIRQGISLSDAMEQQGEAFPELMIHMFRSAEASGKLEQTAFRMAHHYEKESRLNSKVKNAMIYPCVLAVLIVVVVIIIFTFVLPQFDSLFSQMDELPLGTRVLMWLSNALVTYWLQILIGAVVIVLVLRLIFRIPAVAFARAKMLLKLPIAGKLLKTIYTARFARTLSSLYSSGIPIVTALQTGRNTVGNLYIESQFEAAIARVRAGEDLSSVIADIDGFVKKFSSTIMIGEETGSLDAMLDSIAENLEYESEMAITKLVALLEPLMIVIMAVIVGVIMVSVIMPIYSSYDAIGGGY
jgi:type IV pilus assembly protein PilC